MALTTDTYYGASYDDIGESAPAPAGGFAELGFESKQEKEGRKEQMYYSILERAQHHAYHDVRDAGVLKVVGKDSEGRPIILYNTVAAQPLHGERVLQYLLRTLDPVVEVPYVAIVVCNRDVDPKLLWVKTCLKTVIYKYRKNLKRLFFVHPNPPLKVSLSLLGPFVSRKAWRKIKFINSLIELHRHIPLNQVHFPDIVYANDQHRISSKMFNVRVTENELIMLYEGILDNVDALDESRARLQEAEASSEVLKNEVALLISRTETPDTFIAQVQVQAEKRRALPEEQRLQPIRFKTSDIIKLLRFQARAYNKRLDVERALRKLTGGMPTITIAPPKTVTASNVQADQYALVMGAHRPVSAPRPSSNPTPRRASNASQQGPASPVQRRRGSVSRESDVSQGRRGSNVSQGRSPSPSGRQSPGSPSVRRPRRGSGSPTGSAPAPSYHSPAGSSRSMNSPRSPGTLVGRKVSFNGGATETEDESIRYDDEDDFLREMEEDDNYQLPQTPGTPRSPGSAGPSHESEEDNRKPLYVTNNKLFLKKRASRSTKQIALVKKETDMNLLFDGKRRTITLKLRGNMIEISQPNSKKVDITADATKVEEILYGFKSPAFKDQKLRLDYEWHCFSVKYSQKTGVKSAKEKWLDFSTSNETSVTAWIMAITKLAKKVTGVKLNEGILLWEKVRMKLRYQASMLNLPALTVLAQAIIAKSGNCQQCGLALLYRPDKRNDSFVKCAVCSAVTKFPPSDPLDQSEAELLEMNLVKDEHYDEDEGY